MRLLLLLLLLLVVAGGGGRLRVLCQTAAGDAVLGSQLLRGVRQRRRHDERGRVPHVLLPGTPRSTKNVESPSETVLDSARALVYPSYVVVGLG